MKITYLSFPAIMIALFLSCCSSVDGKLEKAYECCKNVCDESIERYMKVDSLDDPDLYGALKEVLEKEKRDARINCFTACKEGKEKCLQTAKTDPELWKDVWKKNCDRIVEIQKRVLTVATLDDPDLDRKLEIAMQKELREIEKECYSCCSSE